MTPAQAIAMLDRQLEKHGQRITLQRLTSAAGGASIPFDVTVRAFVRNYKPDELVGGIVQSDSKVTISPTEIEEKGWPGPSVYTVAPNTTLSEQDRRVPRKGDNARINGRLRNIEASMPIYLDDELVRIDMHVKG